jgi:hypothetical protein
MLRKGGKVIFETYILEHRDLGTGGPKQSKYYLRPNELLRLSMDFESFAIERGFSKKEGRGRQSPASSPKKSNNWELCR